MALVVGTNCGFVSASPVGDPAGTGWAVNAGDAFAARHTSPVGNNIVTEIGWWQGGSDNSPSVNYNMGLYDDNAGEPGSLVTAQSTGQVTTVDTASWYAYSGLSIPILPETVYWIGIGIGIVGSGANYFDASADASELYRFEDIADYTLSDPFSVDGGPAFLFGIYAKYEAVPAVELLLFEHSLGGNVLGGNAGRMTE